MSLSQSGQYPIPYIEQERAPEKPRIFETPQLALIQRILIGVIAVGLIFLVFFVISYVQWLYYCLQVPF